MIIDTRPHTVTASAPRFAVVAEGVSCAYGKFLAIDGISLSVQTGRIHALLGTNGAGKTTLLENIQGFRRPVHGSLRVFGQDPYHARTAIAGRLGTMLQESGLVDEMTVAGQLAFWQGVSVREDSIDRVLRVVGLEHRRKVPVSVLSGGERRRLDFAMAIWGDPELVILDEPTTGLDPQSRRTMWSIIQELNSQGTTVLLTTHYLDEAQNLADHVTILDRGRVAVEGPMADVLASIPAQITFTVATGDDTISDLSDRLTTDTAATQIQTARPESGADLAVTIRTRWLQTDVGIVVDWSRAYGLTLGQLRCAPASLEEVFFELPSATDRTRGQEAAA